MMEHFSAIFTSFFAKKKLSAKNLHFIHGTIIMTQYYITFLCSLRILEFFALTSFVWSSNTQWRRTSSKCKLIRIKFYYKFGNSRVRFFSIRLEILRVLTQDGKNIQHLEDDIGEYHYHGNHICCLAMM